VRRQWTARVAAGCLLAVATLSGCAEKHEASTTLPSASSASGAELPPLGPADFPVPDEARTQDAAGAEAALRYYLALADHLDGQAGEPLRELSRDCSTCTFLADRNDQDAAAGYASEGGETTVRDMSRPAVDDTSAQFSFSVSQAAIVVRDSSGIPVPDRGSDMVPLLTGAAAMTWDSDLHAWLVTQLFFRQP
jgi:hypothetical protein